MRWFTSSIRWGPMRSNRRSYRSIWKTSFGDLGNENATAETQRTPRTNAARRRNIFLCVCLGVSASRRLHFRSIPIGGRNKAAGKKNRIRSGRHRAGAIIKLQKIFSRLADQWQRRRNAISASAIRRARRSGDLSARSQQRNLRGDEL